MDLKTRILLFRRVCPSVADHGISRPDVCAAISELCVGAHDG